MIWGQNDSPAQKRHGNVSVGYPWRLIWSHRCRAFSWIWLTTSMQSPWSKRQDERSGALHCLAVTVWLSRAGTEILWFWKGSQDHCMGMHIAKAYWMQERYPPSLQARWSKMGHSGRRPYGRQSDWHCRYCIPKGSMIEKMFEISVAERFEYHLRALEYKYMLSFHFRYNNRFLVSDRHVTFQICCRRIRTYDGDNRKVQVNIDRFHCSCLKIGRPHFPVCIKACLLKK